MKNQRVKRRRPQQSRSLQKVELILEAAMRLLERGDVDTLTTNAVAEKAGISIGTLYQYFDDKQAILQALTQRELDGLAARVVAAVSGAPPDAVGGRIPIVVRAVLDSYGGRRRVHRLLLEHALSRGPANRLSPLYKGLVDLLSTQGVSAPGQAARSLRAADAFVLTHAFAGVMRATVVTENRQIPRAELEESLSRLVVAFVKGAQAAQSGGEVA